MARTVSDRVKLLHGPYKAPRLRRSDRPFCLFSDCDVVVTAGTDARLPCPRCRPIDIQDTTSPRHKRKSLNLAGPEVRSYGTHFSASKGQHFGEDDQEET